MGYLDTYRACDRGEHDRCNGTVTVLDQDGYNSYVCNCYHQHEALNRQRAEEAEAKVRRLMRELGLDQTHELVRKP